MKELRKALKKDRVLLLQNARDNRFLSRWLDNFDPKAQYGIQAFQRVAESILAVPLEKFQYVPA